VTRVLDALRTLGLEGVISTDRHWFRCCCPLHDDRSPSFSVNLDSGHYYCYAGCGNGKLHELVLELMRRGQLDFDPNLSTRIELQEREIRVDFKMPKLNYSMMLGSFLHRGFTFDMMRAFEIGYDIELKSMFIPVHTIDGRLVGGIWRQRDYELPKYLNTQGLPRQELLFNAHRVMAAQGKRDILCLEGPLDCVWASAAGYMAVAFLGSKFNEHQVRLLEVLKPDSVILGGDNDAAGATFNHKLGQQTLAFAPTYVLNVPTSAKDVQDVPLSTLLGLERIPYLLYALQVTRGVKVGEHGAPSDTK